MIMPSHVHSEGKPPLMHEKKIEKKKKKQHRRDNADILEARSCPCMAGNDYHAEPPCELVLSLLRRVNTPSGRAPSAAEEHRFLTSLLSSSLGERLFVVHAAAGTSLARDGSGRCEEEATLCVGRWTRRLSSLSQRPWRALGDTSETASWPSGKRGSPLILLTLCGTVRRRSFVNVTARREDATDVGRGGCQPLNASVASGHLAAADSRLRERRVLRSLPLTSSLLCARACRSFLSAGDTVDPLPCPNHPGA